MRQLLLNPLRGLPALSAFCLLMCLSACADAPAATVTPAAVAAANEATAAPRPGKWIGVISNGYKGDTLTFTVSANGRQVQDIAFKGHWRSRSGYTEVLRNLDPPEPIAIASDSFAAVQQVPQAGMWWEVTGRFTGHTAQGSYRASFAGGDNDTYKLKWTAKPAR